MARSKKNKVQKRIQEKKRRKHLRRKETRRTSRSDRFDSFLTPGFGPPFAMRQKLSEVIIEFAEPLLNTATDIRQEEKALNMAVTFWNLSFQPEKDALKILKDEMVELTSENLELRQEFLDAFHMMYQRKHTHFSNDRRFILSDSIDETPDGLYLQVSSTII